MNRAHISEHGGKGLIRGTLISFPVTLLFGTVSLLLASFVLLQSQNPMPFIRIVGITLPALTAMFGGFIAGIVEKQQAALGGLINGILFASLLFLLSLFIGGDMFSTAQTLIAYTVLLLLSVLGGVLGMTAQKGRKKRRPRRR